jgi:hypothetical protein
MPACPTRLKPAHFHNSLDDKIDLSLLRRCGRSDCSWITGYAEGILTSELGDWIVSQLPTTLNGATHFEHQLGAGYQSRAYFSSANWR